MRLARVHFSFVFAIDGRLLNVQRQVDETFRKILRFVATSRSTNTLVTLSLHFRHADDQRSSVFGEPACTVHDSRVVVHVVQGRHADVGRSFQVRLGAVF